MEVFQQIRLVAVSLSYFKNPNLCILDFEPPFQFIRVESLLSITDFENSSISTVSDKVLLLEVPNNSVLARVAHVKVRLASGVACMRST